MPWPLLHPPSLPDPPGRFGALRRHDIHTGIDLYCPIGTPVLSIEPGRVVRIEPFTGAHVPPPDSSPWWNDTWAVLVEGVSGVFVYGEVVPLVREGQEVAAGAVIGRVDVPVLKQDKGRPTVMLHLEQMRAGSRRTVWWRHGEAQPEGLLDPTGVLEGILLEGIYGMGR